MGFDAVVYNVMLSCPSDIKEEKDIFAKVLRKYNNLHSAKNNIVLLPIMWESDSIPIQGEHPQNLINEMVLSKSDILIAIFWTRLGTPTDVALSGSVEEIEKHITTGKPTLLYLCTKSPNLSDIDTNQLSELRSFIDKNKNKGLYHEYEDLHDFEDTLYKNIVHLINNNDLKNINIQNKKNDKMYLSMKAKYILKEASKSKDGMIFRIKNLGGTTYQVNKDECTPTNPRDCAEMEEALNILEQYDLIKPENLERDLFKITSKGFEVADNLNDISNKQLNETEKELISFIEKLPIFQQDIKKMEKYFDEMGHYKMIKLSPHLEKLDILKIISTSGEAGISIKSSFHKYDKNDIEMIIQDIKRNY